MVLLSSMQLEASLGALVHQPVACWANYSELSFFRWSGRLLRGLPLFFWGTWFSLGNLSCLVAIPVASSSSAFSGITAWPIWSSWSAASLSSFLLCQLDLFYLMIVICRVKAYWTSDIKIPKFRSSFTTLLMTRLLACVQNTTESCLKKIERHGLRCKRAYRAF